MGVRVDGCVHSQPRWVAAGRRREGGKAKFNGVAKYFEIFEGSSTTSFKADLDDEEDHGNAATGKEEEFAAGAGKSQKWMKVAFQFSMKQF